MRIRQALNVEVGLNDGLVVPFLMFFIGLAAAKTEGRAAKVTCTIVSSSSVQVWCTQPFGKIKLVARL